MCDYRARYYGSNMGRWMSPDWAANATAVPYADFSDPQSLNLYGYVRNNPLSHADTDGHFWRELKNWLNWGVWVNDKGLDHALHQMADAYRQKYPNIDPKGTNSDTEVIKTGRLTDSIRDLQDPEKMIGLIGGGTAEVEEGAVLAGKSLLTRWGWAGSGSWRAIVKTLQKAGTHTAEDLGGKIPTLEEAKQLIKSAGGTIERIEEGHAPGGVSPHTYPHINYTTAAGEKATVQIAK